MIGDDWGLLRMTIPSVAMKLKGGSIRMSGGQLTSRELSRWCRREVGKRAVARVCKEWRRRLAVGDVALGQ